MQKEVMVKALLDSGATGLVISSEFAKKVRVQVEENRKTNLCEKYE